MATKKRGKAARGAGRVGKAASKPSVKRASAARSRAKKPAARHASGGSAVDRALAALRARHERQRAGFEKRLTEAVREIGQLRHHEARAAQLEQQLKERDQTIGKLRVEITALRNRPRAGSHDPNEVQPSLAFSGGESEDLDDLADFDDEEDDHL